MIHHIVQWTLKDPAEAPRFKALLDGCAGHGLVLRMPLVGIERHVLDFER